MGHISILQNNSLFELISQLMEINPIKTVRKGCNQRQQQKPVESLRTFYMRYRIKDCQDANKRNYTNDKTNSINRFLNNLIFTL